MRKDFKYQEFHDDETEYFPAYNATRKNKTGFPAFALIVAAAAVVLTTVATISMYVSCSPISISPDSAILNMEVVNADTDTPIDYLVYEYEKGRDIRYYYDNGAPVQTGETECKDAAINLKGLAPETKYVIIFKATDGRDDANLGSYVFTTGSYETAEESGGGGTVIPVKQSSSSGSARNSSSYEETSSEAEESSSDSSSSSSSSYSSSYSSSKASSSSSSTTPTTPTTKTYKAPKITQKSHEITRAALSASETADVTVNDGTIDYSSLSVTVTYTGMPDREPDVYMSDVADNVISAAINYVYPDVTYTVTYSLSYTLPDGTSGTATATDTLYYSSAYSRLTVSPAEAVTYTATGTALSCTTTLDVNEGDCTVASCYAKVMLSDGVTEADDVTADCTYDSTNSLITADLNNVSPDTEYEILYYVTYTYPDGTSEDATASKWITVYPTFDTPSIDTTGGSPKITIPIDVGTFTVDTEAFYDGDTGTYDSIDITYTTASVTTETTLWDIAEFLCDDGGNLIFIDGFGMTSGETYNLNIQLGYLVNGTHMIAEKTISVTIP